MSDRIHHITLFVEDIERSLHLFQDILGFTLQWRRKFGDPNLAQLVGLEDVENDVAYLQNTLDDVAVELIHQIRPRVHAQPLLFGTPGTVSMSIMVKSIDNLHGMLVDEGWQPFTEPAEIESPDGEKVRLLFFKTEEGITIELIEII